MYSLTEDGEYSEQIPAASAIGEYTVYYQFVGDAQQSDGDI